jgi:hypothetical protein
MRAKMADMGVRRAAAVVLALGSGFSALFVPVVLLASEAQRHEQPSLPNLSVSTLVLCVVLGGAPAAGWVAFVLHRHGAAVALGLCPIVLFLLVMAGSGP